MKILAIESSSTVASAAIITEDTLIAEYTLNHKMTHSQTLLPMIDEIVRLSGTQLEEFDAIAVSGGPGSFTGLRIGSSTAKGLGLALDKPLIHIPTMDAMAFNLFGTDSIICPLMDARRTQVYYGFYRCRESLQVLQQQNIELICEVVSKLNSLGESVIFLGDGVDANISYIRENVKVPYMIAPAHLNRNKAASVGALGVIYYKEGKLESAAQHLPNYLRASQAERELQERLQTAGDK
jgi:tRNA threonylcarbamoyladenosine biosynthesis protein TsaB